MKNLPVTNIHHQIPKKDAWLVWTHDEQYQINDFNIYDLSKGRECVAYVEMHVRKGYSDWGASFSSWDQVCLADVLFKFGFQDKLADDDVKKQFLDSLTLIEEWRDDVLMYMGFINMQHYFSKVKNE